ncbi:MAG: TsaB protein required for threonylcarbamoyladenosine ((6)A) formation in tRNA [Chitinophagaceae bacterium]|nr:TsaB protein required for threonylcarbamoyladenosine ((6)A) formation in tRNA [Chitinophagaceae bacterium]
MALILNIDTATEHASVSLSGDGQIIQFLESPDQKNHAAFVQPAIRELMQLTGIGFKQLDAIAVSGGPGSYTGLRVGLASAKGICYACKKPLIMINTLLVMALSLKDSVEKMESSNFCPMIDARRNEVFTALYNPNLQELMPPQALILSETAFDIFLDKGKVIFGGSGALKAGKVITHDNAVFLQIKNSPAQLGNLAEQAFNAGRFADLAYTEPFYCKEFFSAVV